MRVGNPESTTISLFRRKERLKGGFCPVSGITSRLKPTARSLEITAEIGPGLVLDLIRDRFRATFCFARVVETAHAADMQFCPAGATFFGAKERQAQGRE
jgi:hypothetical protein